MKQIVKFCRYLVDAKWFELLIIGVIFANCILIGVETYAHHDWIKIKQGVILGIFTFEIIARFIARDSLRSFFLSGWNNFDMILVLVSYVPETLFSNVSAILMLRVQGFSVCCACCVPRPKSSS
jgi:voltage-gated sodium channel